MIEIVGLEKSYGESNFKINIFNNLNITFKTQSSNVIFAPSGSGKSTLLNLISGLDNDFIGDIKINNQSIKDLSNKYFFKNTIGVIFQDHYLIQEINIKNNILINSTESDYFSYLINLLGLNNLIYKLPSEISNGQKQRVCIARSLINKPELIIADEPTSYLDFDNGQIVMRELINITKNTKTTVLCCTHDLSFKKLFDNSYTIKNQNLIRC